ncbi:MAG: S8 family serine peptidase [Bacteroidales bacterium]|nr:S8 family serine peptidase [Bacteroidales bacterium]MDZ4205456.1 S8 family serine peptidase [Bacteroidales bacterium]
MKARKSTIWFFAFLFLPNSFSYGQSRGFSAPTPPIKSYWVYFKDKDRTGFDPYIFFEPKAIERRLRHGQDLFDPLDFPVNESYLAGVGSMVDSMDVISRWLNAVNVYASQQQAEAIKQLPFVDRVESGNRMMVPAAAKLKGLYLATLTDEQLMLLRFQTSHMKGSYFSDYGIDGRGVRIAIFDNGFPGVDVHPVFKHIVDEARIIATRDFFRNNPDVFHKNEHGTMVMSLIGGMIDSIPMGLAPGAEFLLARTETWREPFIEEKYWLAAAEWADQLGADIISSSLGYTYHRYFPDQMDGQTSLVARAASIAFQKGILVVNAAGNDGGKESWKVIATPADAPGVLAVGALDYPSMLSASYSSRGPASDGRVKPNVSALGTVYVANAKGFTLQHGTSFSSPLVAGFAACLMQMHPEWTNIQVFNALQQSATLYPYYDLSHGYGIPQADYFFRDSLQEPLPTFDFVESKNQVKVIIRYTHADVMEKVLNSGHVYYHIRDEKGNIEQYFVARVRQKEVLSFEVANFTHGKQVFIHLAGYTASWSF